MLEVVEIVTKYLVVVVVVVVVGVMVVVAGGNYEFKEESPHIHCV